MTGAAFSGRARAHSGSAGLGDHRLTQPVDLGREWMTDVPPGCGLGSGKGEA